MPSKIIIPFRGQNIASGYDVDAQALFTALETDASPVTLSDSVKGYWNTYVLGMKTDGLWSDLVGLYQFLGGTAASCKYNGKDPRDLDAAYRLTPYNSPTFSNNGVVGNGSTTSLDTHIPNTTVGESAFYISIYSRTNVDELGVLFGFSATNGKMFPKFSNTFYSDVPNEAERLQVNTAYNTAAEFAVTLTATRVQTAYRNGSQIAQRTNGAETLSTGTIHLLANDHVPNYPTTRQICMALIVNQAWNSTKVANAYSRSQTLQTSLGRNV